MSSIPETGQVYNAYVPLFLTLSKRNLCAWLMLEVKTAQWCIIMQCTKDISGATAYGDCTLLCNIMHWHAISQCCLLSVYV